MVRPPSYDGRGLVNLVAEVELRLGGAPRAPTLTGHLASSIPDAASYVFVLFDGLGDSQLDHPKAGSLNESRRGVIDAPFPTTTTVSLATAATGVTPAEHGIIGYQMWFAEVSRVVNVLKWTTPGGEPIDFDYDTVLPFPNLWERLASAGIEAITIQPYSFEGSALSRMLYRGCRQEPIWSEEEIVEATVQLAREPRRLVFTYVPHVDVAAHVTGQDNESYEVAMAIADKVWRDIASRLPDDVVAIGTADHGHIDYDDGHKVAVKSRKGIDFFGDPRALYVRGSDADSFPELPGQWISRDTLLDLLGHGQNVHPQLDGRIPDACLLADPGYVVLPSTMDSRWIGYHGGLESSEVEVPLLVAGG